jgi:hypothetical protein
MLSWVRSTWATCRPGRSAGGAVASSARCVRPMGHLTCRRAHNGRSGQRTWAMVAAAAPAPRATSTSHQPPAQAALAARPLGRRPARNGRPPAASSGCGAPCLLPAAPPSSRASSPHAAPLCSPFSFPSSFLFVAELRSRLFRFIFLSPPIQRSAFAVCRVVSWRDALALRCLSSFPSR